MSYYQASHANINVFKRTVTTIDRTEIKRRLELAKAYNASLSVTSTQATQPVLKDPYSEEQKKAGRAEYARMLEVREQIGHVMIPKINQDLPIYAGSGEDNLQRGVGHLEGTSLPIGGPSTHAVLTAHRGLPTARLFTDLDKMRRGDRFDELCLVPDKDYVTLLTCTPYMINSHRLLVRGVRVPLTSRQAKKESLTAVRPYQYYRWLVYLAIAVLIILVMIVAKYYQKTNKSS
ncbi:sortase [Streptococcus dysgalactiae subsp. equisimilis]|nr:sortase [Streptococcus dysgalactiae subsp. equisimilis]